MNKHVIDYTGIYPAHTDQNKMAKPMDIKIQSVFASP